MCKVLISGGGSGGHIFPAIAIAKALEKQRPEVKIKFVGALGKMEMEKVPRSGYEIEGLWISGFQRKSSLKNLLLPFKVISSLWKSMTIIRSFKPDLVIGVGGYASGPLLYVANKMGIMTAIQEQNGFPGITNRILSRQVNYIFTAFPGLERFFPSSKIHLFGNPVRESILDLPSRDAGCAHFELNSSKRTVLVFGGSLGARVLNEGMRLCGDRISQLQDVQWIWQMGAAYHKEYVDCATAKLPNVRAVEFIFDMEMAYAASDLVVCRSGALTMAELAAVGRPSVLVPSPNVSEDHQYKNAQVFAEQGAAVVIRDTDFKDVWFDRVTSLISDEHRLRQISQRMSQFSKRNAADEIVSFLLEKGPCK